MATSKVRCNLLAADFPLLSGLYGKSVVVAQNDMHYVRPNAFTGSEADKNIGIPQNIFCENVLPSSYGLQSIAFDAAVVGGVVAQTDFDQAFYLRDVSEARTLFVPGISGTNCKRYTYDQATKTWVNSTKTVPAGSKCTVSSLKKRTFVHVEFDDEFWEWNAAWSNIVFTGLTAANIKGILASSGYNICYDYDTIYWSSVTDPVDFVPSLATGAGSEKPLDVKGRIVVCYPTDSGFLIHTTSNVVSVRYSGNIRFPWVYKEIKNSSGISDQEQTTPDGEAATLYTFSNDGLMQISTTKADQVFPAISEFLACRLIESWNAVTKTIDKITLTDRPVTKVDFIGNRWLVISYGAVALTHALVYDSALKRWGKVRVDHVDAFEFQGNPGTPGSTASLAWANLAGAWVSQNVAWASYGLVISGGTASFTFPYKSLAFLQANGTVQVANFDYMDTRGLGVLYLGRVQFVRNHLTELLEIEAEGMKDEAQNALAVITTFPTERMVAPTVTYVYRMPKLSGSEFTKWQTWLTGVNHTLRFEGNFRLATVEVRGKDGGSW